MSVKEQLIFEGDSATVVKIETMRKVSASELLRNLQSSGGLVTPILPPGCVQFKQNGGLIKYYVVRPGRIINCSTREFSGGLVPIPDTLYVITFNRSEWSAAFSGFYIDSSENNHRVRPTWLPNQSNSGDICLGSLSEDVARASSTNEKISTVIDCVESRSLFNTDYNYYAGRTPEEVKSILLSPSEDDSEIISELKNTGREIIERQSSDGEDAQMNLNSTVIKWTIWVQRKIASGEDPVAISSELSKKIEGISIE